MKKHNACKVVLITMLIFLLLTWILPAAYYSGEYVDQGRVQMGLFDLFNYPLTALSYFGYISLFIILVGGFYGILFKIPAYRSFLDAIVKKAKGKEKLVLSIMVIVNALLVSICGVQIGLALMIPFLVSIVLLMGYDKIVAGFVTVGSICAGLIGTTFAYSSLSVLLSSFSLKFDYQIGVRFVILAVSVILVIFNMLMYIRKNGSNVKIEKKVVKKIEEEVVEEMVEVRKPSKNSSKSSSKSTKTSKSGSKNTKSSTNKKSTKSSKSRSSDRKAALKDEDVIVVKEAMSENDSFVPSAVNGKHKIWPFVIFLGLLFVLFVLAFISWGDSGFKVKFFDDITKAMQSFKLFGFPIFAKLLGSVNSFGNWSITDLFLPMFLVIVLLILVYKVKMQDVVDGFVMGAKKALAPAVISILVYSILVLVTYHPFQLVIYKAILGGSKGFNIVKTAGVALLASIFNADISYAFQSAVPYYSSIVTNTENYGIAAIIFQSVYGLSMLFVPTSLVLMATLSYLKVSYKDWLKSIWMLLIELFIVLLIVFIILTVI